MPGLFVTATGTEVGKTYVTAGLLRAGRRAGLTMDALKPVLSGVSPDAMEASDAGSLLSALDRPVTAATVVAIAPWRFVAPLSPDMAAEAEGRRLDFASLVRACRDKVRPDALTLIEGVGGVMVPLDDRHTVLDLIAALDLPLILVSPTGLGAISHLLTALAALRLRDLSPHAIILNETAGSSVPLAATRATLRRFCGDVPLLDVRRHADAAAFDTVLAALLPIDDAGPVAPSRRTRTAP